MPMSDNMRAVAPQKQINNWFNNARKRYPRRREPKSLNLHRHETMPDKLDVEVPASRGQDGGEWMGAVLTDETATAAVVKGVMHVLPSSSYIHAMK